MRLKDGIHFRRILDERGLSYRDLAEKVGVTSGFISQVINDKRGCTAETAALIVHALRPTNLTVDALFDTQIGPKAAAQEDGEPEPGMVQSTSALPESA